MTGKIIRTRCLIILLLISNQLFAEQFPTTSTPDSIRVSRHEWQSLLQRVSALEQAQKKNDIPINNDTSAHRAPEPPRWIHNRLRIGGYGEITAKRCFYSNKYVRYITPEKYKNDSYGEFDLPHFVINLGYDFGKGWSFGTEIEFEHGGVEAAKEIEEQEGGSEVEQEIERGGEVALEQFWIEKKFNDYAVIRAGMQVIPVGGLNTHHESTEYFGVYRPEGEYTILPSTWHEVALTFMGKTRFGLKYQAMFLPGLDSDRFSRKNWVKTGAGSPYEFKLANVYAGAARIDYTGVKGLSIGLSGYCGSSFRNSLSDNVNGELYKGVKGLVSIGSVDLRYSDYNVVVRGQFTYGHLGDSQLITKYNSTSQVANKTRVASDALAGGVEVGYDFFGLDARLRNQRQRFYVFARYEYYDSMFRYNGNPTTVNAWCGRHRMAAGLNYYPIPQVGVKAEYAYAILKKGSNITYNDEPMVAVGIVFAGMFRP